MKNKSQLCQGHLKIPHCEMVCSWNSTLFFRIQHRPRPFFLAIASFSFLGCMVYGREFVLGMENGMSWKLLIFFYYVCGCYGRATEERPSLVLSCKKTEQKTSEKDIYCFVHLLLLPLVHIKCMCESKFVFNISLFVVLM